MCQFNFDANQELSNWPIRVCIFNLAISLSDDFPSISLVVRPIQDLRKSSRPRPRTRSRERNIIAEVAEPTFNLSPYEYIVSSFDSLSHFLPNIGVSSERSMFRFCWYVNSRSKRNTGQKTQSRVTRTSTSLHHVTF